MNTDIKKDRVDPIQEEMAKNISNYNLTIITEQDFETMALFKNIPGFIAFKTTLSKDNQLLSIGYGSGVCNRFNKFVERTVIFAKNASLVDAMVRSTKILDALSIMPTNKKEEKAFLEDQDKPAFYSEEDMPQVATEKQRKFLVQLLEKCNDSTKAEYLEQIHSPYFSRFEASELISSLLPMK